MVIDSFRNNYFFLSNFYSSPVRYADTVFQNSEAAFQSQKCPERMHEFVSLNPSEAKRLGRRVPLRKDWEAVKDQIMYEIVFNKFTSNKYLARCLIATGNAELIEGNNWNDTYWGVCNGVGKNKLGQILMQVREELK